MSRNPMGLHGLFPFFFCHRCYLRTAYGHRISIRVFITDSTYCINKAILCWGSNDVYHITEIRIVLTNSFE
jgi:hypothetical protein